MDSDNNASSVTSRLGLSWRGMMSLGPGFVYSLTLMGAGDVVSNSAAGATFRYSLIWALGLTLIFRFVLTNTTATYVLVTGESLLAGYRRLGNWVVWIILFATIVLRHFFNLYLIIMCGDSANLLFPLPTEWSNEIWSFFFVLVGFAIMFWGGYPAVEAFSKVLVGILGGSLIIAALLSRPDPVGILQGTFLPSLPQSDGLYSSLFILMALIGTEAGSVVSLSYAYFIREKGWKSVADLKRQRWDLVTGVIYMFVIGSLLQIAAAGIIHPLGIDIENAEDLVHIFSDTQGWVGWIIFGLGLWGATFSTFVGANTGCALIVTDICRMSIPYFKKSSALHGEPDDSVKKDPIYRWIIFFWSFSPLYILFTDVRPIWLVLMVSSVVVIVIPLVGLVLLKLTNDRKLMGKYRNGWLTNVALTILILVALYMTYNNAVKLWNTLNEWWVG